MRAATDGAAKVGQRLTAMAATQTAMAARHGTLRSQAWTMPASKTMIPVKMRVLLAMIESSDGNCPRIATINAPAATSTAPIAQLRAGT